MTMSLERTMHEAVSMGTEDKMETSRKFELPGNMECLPGEAAGSE